MTRKRTPHVVFQPVVHRNMQRGINQLVKAIRPTLGPLARVVAVERTGQYKTPELLHSGGVIARRIIGLSDCEANVGAMFFRHVLWRVHEAVGDGTATTAVLFEAIFNQALRYIAAGGNALVLRRYLNKGMRLIMSELTRMAVALEGREKLVQMAESVCHDSTLAEMLGEILSIIGQYGRLEIRPGHGCELKTDYFEGAYWESGLLSSKMADDLTQLRAEITDAAVLISDLELKDLHEMLTFLAMAKQTGIYRLLIVADKISDLVTALLIKAKKELAKFKIIAAQTPGKTPADQIAAMEDLSILTGGRPLLKIAGDTLSGIKPKDLGRTRRAWADRNHLGIVRGQGAPRVLRSHIDSLRRAFDHATERNVRLRLRERIGKLMGGTAVLWVGGASALEIQARKDLAERTANALRGAIREGIVPGGGVSLLACRAALEQKFSLSANADERFAYRILINAMEAPTRAIVDNAGYEPGAIIAGIASMGNSAYGFDLRSGQVVDMVQRGIWDATAVLKAAVQTAVAGAALALTADVVVHHAKPRESVEP